MRVVAMVFDQYLAQPREQVTRFSRVI